MRYSIECTGEAVQRVTGLLGITGLKSPVDVFRAALRVYDSLIRHQLDGWTITLSKGGEVFKRLDLLRDATESDNERD
jgi:hypothetical protein